MLFSIQFLIATFYNVEFRFRRIKNRYHLKLQQKKMNRKSSKIMNLIALLMIHFEFRSSIHTHRIYMLKHTCKDTLELLILLINNMVKSYVLMCSLIKLQ